MADDSEHHWDEYEWERFLQQQDRKTERYMELLDKYLDDPNRDQIIAREMGWYHLLDEDGDKWIEDVDLGFTEQMQSFSDETEPEPSEEIEIEPGSFEKHPLYQASFALTIWNDRFYQEHKELQNHPAAVRLGTNCAVASAKLAAALSDDDVDEIGMTIAYLKRALKAITVAMEAAGQLRTDATIEPERYATLCHRLFQVRDGIITLMGEFRAEWRRRADEN